MNKLLDIAQDKKERALLVDAYGGSRQDKAALQVTQEMEGA